MQAKRYAAADYEKMKKTMRD
jgi:hypothetical protein